MLLLQVLKLSLLFGLALYCYLVTIDTQIGMQPNTITKFTLDKELKDIPNINLDRLKNAQYYHLPGASIEDVAVDREGNVYAISSQTLDGPSNIYKLSAYNYSLYTKIGETAGLVLGTALNKQQTLLAFADQKQGIKILDLQTKQIKSYTNSFEGKQLISLNSLTFGHNSSILYFTHSCIFRMKTYHIQILYKSGTGQVVQLNLQTGQTRLILDGLQFANGIAYDQKQNCLYVNEFDYYRILKIPLDQQKSGKHKQKFSVLADNLIGYPDNAKITEDGKLWIAMPSLRNKINLFIDNHPAVRKALINAKIPQNLFTLFFDFSYSGGIKVDPKNGKIIDYFFGKSQQINFVTGMAQQNKKIYMASLKKNLIAVADYI